jgi:hypothetical protein
VNRTSTKLVVVIAAVAAIGVLIALYVGLWATDVPKTIAATPSSSALGPTTKLTLQTDAAVGPQESPSHPDWVGYLVRRGGKWIRSTIYQVPAHSLVHVTIYQFDGDSGLRNPFLSQARGTVGGTFQLNGKTTQAIDPDSASHVFAIPQIGLSVPLEGVPDSAKNPCSNAPCPGADKETISFTFRTPGKGLYRWQCFVPCAAGFIQGFGGPMQTVGYMDGFIKVV